MENTPENVVDAGLQGNPITVTPEIINYLSTIRKWSKFFAILGFICIGLFVIGGLFMGLVLSNLSAVTGGSMPFFSGYLGFIYIIFAVLYFFPVLYLYRFADYMKKAIQWNDNQSFTLSFYNLKRYLNFIGILTIVVLSLYALAIVMFAIIAMAFHSKM
jgi:hypothetical protein